MAAKRGDAGTNDFARLVELASKGSAISRLEAIVSLGAHAEKGGESASPAIMALKSAFTVRFPAIWQAKGWSDVKKTQRERFVTTLTQIDPEWLEEFAADAVVSLKSNEKTVRNPLLAYLFRKRSNVADGLEGICAALARLRPWTPRKRTSPRRVAFGAILDAATGLDHLNEGPRIADALSRIALILEPPADGEAIIRMKGRVAALLAKIRGHSGAPDFVDLHLDEAHFEALLKSPSRALGRPVEAALWQQLANGERSEKDEAPRPAPFTADDAVILQVDQLAAGLAQMEYGARSAFMSADSVMTRAFEALRNVDADLAGDFKKGLNRQRRIMQGIRDLARQRAFEPAEAEGDIVPYDAARHEIVSHATPAPAHVRLLEPPIVRRGNGSSEIILKRGRAEAAD